MAKLDQMPQMSVIKGLRGVVDFYEWFGIPVARKWPRKPIGARSQAVRSNNQLFKTASDLSKQLSPEVINAFRRTASGTPYTWRDCFFRAYLSGLPTEFYTGLE